MINKYQKITFRLGWKNLNRKDMKNLPTVEKDSILTYQEKQKSFITVYEVLQSRFMEKIPAGKIYRTLSKRLNQFQIISNVKDAYMNNDASAKHSRRKKTKYFCLVS